MKTPSVFILASALVLTVAYHAFFAERPFGFPFAILVVLALVGVQVLLKLAERKVNRWAYVFLIPVVCATSAKMLYSSPVVQTLGFCLAVISLALYAYWISAPRIPFTQIKSASPLSFFLETIWPFKSLEKLFAGLESGKHWARALIGVLLAIPFVFVIGTLFASADPLFYKVVHEMLSGVAPSDFVGKGIRDMIVMMFFLGSGWTIYSRASEERAHEHRRELINPGAVVTGVFLSLLNLLFLVFLGFQFAYFFGGEEFVRSQGLTYAEYARSGFFQLILVAGIVFVISWFVYRATELHDRVTKSLTCALIVETGVIIISATKRLFLYIDTYGFTVARYWAFVSISLIGAVLLFLLVSALMNRRFEFVAKLICVGVVTCMSALLLVNVEAHVVRFNVERFMSGRINRIDLNYMLHLSSDALPESLVFAKQDWKSAQDSRLSNADHSDQEWFRKSIQANAEAIKGQVTQDWRFFSVSDYFAIRAAATMETQ